METEWGTRKSINKYLLSLRQREGEGYTSIIDRFFGKQRRNRGRGRCQTYTLNVPSVKSVGLTPACSLSRIRLTNGIKSGGGDHAVIAGLNPASTSRYF